MKHPRKSLRLHISLRLLMKSMRVGRETTMYQSADNANGVSTLYFAEYVFEIVQVRFSTLTDMLARF